MTSSVLNIPGLKLPDGPLEIRGEKATAFPCRLARGTAWDVGLAQRVGVAFRKERRNKGRQVWLGSCVNIVRVPQHTVAETSKPTVRTRT
jgi:beta-glucosidase